MDITNDERQLILAYRSANKMYKAVALELLQTHPAEAKTDTAPGDPGTVINLQQYKTQKG